MVPKLLRFGWPRSDAARRLALRTLVALFAATVVVSAWHVLLPTFGPVTYQYDRNAPVTGVLPLDFPSAGKVLQVHATVRLAAVHPVLFSIVPDDCLESLTVNGSIVPSPDVMCFDRRGGTIWLNGHVHRGDNTIDLRIKDAGGRGGVRMGVSLADPVLLFFAFLVIAIGLAYAASLVAIFGHRPVALAVLAIVAIGLSVRLPFVLTPGYSFDVRLWSGWAKNAVELGLGPSYLREAESGIAPNYPPFSMEIFAATGRAYRWLLSPSFDAGLPDCVAFMKLPFILADVATSVLLFFVTLKLRGGRLREALVAGVIYALHPAVLYESAVWGQVDSLFTLVSLATLAAALAKRWTLVGALAALALLTKLQALVIVPAVVLMCWLEKRALRRAVMGAVATVLLVLLPFLSQPSLKAIKGVYLNSTGYFPIISMYADNAWMALFGQAERERPDTGLFFGVISYRHVGLLLFASWALGLPLASLRRFRLALREPAYAGVMFVVPALTTYAFFLFNTEMHERYLFPLMSLGLPMILASRRGLYAYLASSVLFLLNLLAVLPWTVVDRTIYHELPNLPAFIGGCHLLAFGVMVSLLRRA